MQVRHASTGKSPLPPQSHDCDQQQDLVRLTSHTVGESCPSSVHVNAAVLPRSSFTVGLL